MPVPVSTDGHDRGSQARRAARIDVTSWPVRNQEPAGGEEKVWLTDTDGTAWLFKPVVARDGRRQGEDWAEYIAAKVAKAMCVPAAEVLLASRSAHEGCLSKDVSPGEWTNQPGSVLLAEVVDHLDKSAKNRIGHSLTNVGRVLTGFGAPPGFVGPDWMTAFDVFAGYLTFDALIGNRDRHSDNWSVLEKSDEHRLMDSYDHASSLGFQLLDARRRRLLSSDPELERWVRKGTAHRFENGRHTSLVALAHEALSMAQPGTREHWLAAVESISPSTIALIVDEPETMSQPARSLASAIMRVNRERLIHRDRDD